MGGLVVVGLFPATDSCDQKHDEVSSVFLGRRENPKCRRHIRLTYMLSPSVIEPKNTELDPSGFLLTTASGLRMCQLWLVVSTYIHPHIKGITSSAMITKIFNNKENSRLLPFMSISLAFSSPTWEISLITFHHSKSRATWERNVKSTQIKLNHFWKNSWNIQFKKKGKICRITKFGVKIRWMSLILT